MGQVRAAVAPVTMSEQVLCEKVVVCRPFPPILLKDFLSVNASTRLVSSLICLFISERLWLTDFWLVAFLL